jgi:hypothetical protein
MPTVRDYLRNPPQLATLRDRWLVLTSELAERVRGYQSPDAPHRVEPTETADGNFVICADVLTERAGIFAGLWSQIDQAIAADIDIIAGKDVAWKVDETA